MAKKKDPKEQVEISEYKDYSCPVCGRMSVDPKGCSLHSNIEE